MAKNIQVLVNTGNEETTKTIDVTAKNGQATRIRVVKGARYQLEDPVAKGMGPEKISSKRVSKDLHVTLDGSKDADLIIEGYYDEEMIAEQSHGLYGRAEDGQLYEYIPEDPTPDGLSINLVEGGKPVSQVLGTAPVGEAFELSSLTAATTGFNALNAAAASAGTAAAAGAGGGGGGATGATPTPIATDTTTPKVAIASNAQSAGLGKSTTLTFTFDESVINFDVADIDVVGGSISNLQQSTTDTKVWTATFTRSLDQNTNAVSISVKSGKFSDAAGNLNSDGSDADNTVEIAWNNDGNDSISGGEGNDTLNGGNGNDSINGGNGDDNIDGGEGNDTLNGGNGNDSISGGNGDDTIDGGEGDDTLNGGNGNDAISGGNGADLIDGGEGNDTLDGGEGNDTLSGGNGNDSISGGNGDDVIDGGEGNDTLNGGNGNDAISGGNGADLIDGGEGNDTLNGGNGNDSINGGNGDDLIDGGEGNDTLNGGNGNDSVNGGNGDDTIDGGEGNDTLSGGNGNDSINGGNGDDNIDGGEGDDTLNGGNGNDSISGGNGDDTLDGGEGNDTLNGGNGNDSINGGNGDDNIDGGEGNDTLNGGNGNDSINGGNGADLIDGGEGNDTLDGGEGNDTLNGGNGNDAISGGNGADVIDGGEGNDTLSGGNGNDSVNGGNGDDTIDGGEGNDSVNGGNGNDSISGGNGDDVIDGGEGNDTLDGGEGNDTLSGGNGNDSINGGNGDDTIDGGEGNDSINGGNGNDSVNGGNGNDSINGGNGDDNIDGGEGNDTLDGGEGNDTLSGGNGNDSINGGNGDDTIDGGEGNDSVNSGNGNDSVNGGNGDDVIDGGEGNDTLDGGEGNDTLNGGNGNDSISGGNGDDTIDGGEGNDTLSGGNGNDSINGGNGDDNIDGGEGNDTLSGGNGNDSVNGGNGADLIDGGEGNDTLDGGEGNDTLNGGNGNDSVNGGNGDDTIDGGEGNASINGGNGNDSVNGGNGADFIDGGEGNDSLDGGEGNDTLNGGNGNDSINGGNGDDLIDGGEGNDTLDGGEGNDTLNSGNGNDSINGGNGDDTIDGGEGNDSINGGNGNDSVNGGNGADLIDGGDGNDTLDGGEGNDTLNGGNGNDSVNGGNGDDVIDGGEGNDTLSGGNGNDSINGGNGDDTIDGGEGNDSINSGNGNDSVNGGNGDDVIDGGEGNDTLDGGEGNDTLNGGNGNDSISGGNGADVIDGGEGNDTLDGGEGNDSINGGNGNDSVNGGNGDDNIDGGEGNDTLNGENGNDAISGGNGADLIDGGEGNDTLDGGEGNDSINGGNGNDAISGGNGADLIDGGEGNDTLNGGNGNDSISGGNGNDVIDGGDGNDTIDGGGGDNALDISRYDEAVLVKNADGTGTVTYKGKDGNSYTTTFGHINTVIDNGRAVVEVTSITQDTGSSSTDFLTTDARLTYSGTVTPATNTVISAAAMVKLELINSGGTVVATETVAITNGTWSWNRESITQTDGAYTLRATIVDASGNRFTTKPLASVQTPVMAGNADTDPGVDVQAITIDTNNNAPVAVNNTAIATEAGGTSNGTTGTNPAGNVLTDTVGQDSDPEGDVITVIDILKGTSGTATAVTASTTSVNGASIAGNFGSLKIGADGSYAYTVDNTNATVQGLNASSTALTDTFTYTVKDTGGLSSTATITISINGANDAPVVTTTSTARSYIENAAAIVANNDLSLSDVDSADLMGATVSISSGLTTGDVLSFTNGNGISGSYNSTTGVMSLSGTATVAQYQTALQSVTYSSTSDTPTATSATRTISWQVNDGQATNNLSNVGSSTINVTAVNDAPVVTPNATARSYTENAAAIVANNTLSLSDVDSTSLTGATVQITSGLSTGDVLAFTAANGITSTYAAATGKLTLSGTASKAEYQAALQAVTYSSTSENPTTTSASRTLTWQLNDGASANNLSATATSTINLTAVNNAPTATNATLTVLEDGSKTLAASDFGFSDADGNSLSAVIITSLPSAGTLKLNGTAVTANQSVTAADIAAGKLVFAPAANANGTSYASIGFKVQDNGGTANAGVDTSATANTLTINVTAVNDAPTATNATLTVLEDGSKVFAASDFGFNDADGNSLSAVIITSLPSAGTLKLNGTAVTANQSITKADIDAGKLVFAPAADANGSSYASIGFKVQDNGGTANGGVDTSATANTLTINVTAVNDAPTATNATITVLEDGSKVFAASDFGFSDADGNSLSAVIITSLPSAGTLKLNGTAVTANQSVTAADIAAGKLVFAPAADANGSSYASIGFKVQDNGGSANGGLDTSATANTLTINVTAVNDAPTATSSTITVLEDGSKTLAASDFGFNDADGNSLSAVIITSLPSAGTLKLNGTAVTANQSVTAADIAAGKLVFAPAANANGASYASIGFKVQDNGGTANSGVDTSATANTLTINVTAVNDAPVLADTTLAFAAVLQGSAAPTGAVGSLVSSLVGGVSDVDTGAVQGIAITAFDSTNGKLFFSTNGGTTWTEATGISNTNALLLASDADNRIYFQPNAGFSGTSTSAVTLRAWDQTTGTEGSFVSTATNGGTSAFSSATDTLSELVVRPVTINTVSGDNVVIMNEAVPLTGTANPGATVTLNINGTSRQVTADDSGNWSYSPKLVPLVRYVMVRDILDGTGPYSGAGVFAIDELNVAVNGTSVSAGKTVIYGSGTTTNGATSAITQGTTTNMYEIGGTGEFWVQLDLGGYVRADSITVTPRENWPDRLNGAKIYTSVNDMSAMTSAQLDAATATVNSTLISGATSTTSVTYVQPNSSDEDKFLNGANTITASESVSGVSSAASTTVTWTNPPVVTPSNAVTAYSEQATAVALNSGLALVDVNSATISSATVSISAGLTSGDVLAFTNANGISGSYNSTTGVMSLSGTATVAQYQTALQSVTYSSTSDTPTATSATRTISWQVNDGQATNNLSNVGSSTINVTAVNDAPVVTPNATARSYTENAAAIVANNTLSLSDVDSTSLTGATVQITSGLSTGDVLAFTAANGITSTYAAATGKLTLSGTASKAEYQAALQAVTYSSTSENPTTTSASRTLTWQLNDGASANNLSATATSTINLTAVNDAPVLADTTLAFAAVLQGSAAPTGAVGSFVSSLVGGVSDVDTGAVQGIAITAFDSTNGKLFFSTNGGTTWTEATGISNTNALLLASDADNRIYFQPNASFSGTASSVVTFRAWDKTTGTEGSFVSTATNGGTSAFSSATDTLSELVVRPVTINTVSSDNIVAMNEAVTLTGTANPNATVGLNVGGTTRSVVADSSGNWSYTPKLVPVVRYVMVRKDLDGTFPDQYNPKGAFDIADIAVMQGNTNLAAGMAVSTGLNTASTGSLTSLTDASQISWYEALIPGEQWVQVDLGGYYRVDQVVITDRVNWASRTDGSNIYMSATNLSGKTTAQIEADVTGGLVSKTVISGSNAASGVINGFTATTANATNADNLGTITAAESVSGVSSNASKTVTWRPADSLAIVSAVDNTIGTTPLAMGTGAKTSDSTPTLQGILREPLASGEEVAIWFNNGFIGAATVSGTTWSYELNLPNAGTYTYKALLTQGHLGVETQASNLFTISLDAAPVNTLPSTYVVDINGTNTLSGLSIADSDAGSATMLVKLAVDSGTLNATAGSTTLTGAGTSTVFIAGTVAQVNAALATVTYNRTTGGTATLTMTTSDQLGTATSTDVDTSTITVAAPSLAITAATATTQSTVTDSFTTSTTSADVNSVSTALWDVVATGLSNTLRWTADGSGNNWVINGSYVQVGATVGAASQTNNYTFSLKGGASFKGVSFLAGWGDVINNPTSAITVSYQDAANNVVGTDSFRFDEVGISEYQTFTYDSVARGITLTGQATKFSLSMTANNGFGVEDLTYKTDASSTAYSVIAGGTMLDTTPSWTGTINRPLGAGETVEILRGTTVLGNATISMGSSTWSFTDPNAASVATHSYTARLKSGTTVLATSNAFSLTIASTPIVLDLNDDGVQTTSITKGTQFDLLANGTKQNVGWVSQQDGLLVMDVNGDGQINSGAELFGDRTVLADGSRAVDGWAALRGIDSNHDDKIDAQDAQFKQLRVWVDANSNGVTDAGELRSLADQGIASINLAADDRSVQQNGNVVQAFSTYTTTDGATHEVADVGFAVQDPASSDVYSLINAGSLDLSQATNTAQSTHLDMASDSAANTLTLTLSDVLATDSNVIEGAYSYAAYHANGIDSVQMLIDQAMLNVSHVS